MPTRRTNRIKNDAVIAHAGPVRPISAAVSGLDPVLEQQVGAVGAKFREVLEVHVLHNVGVERA